MDNFNETLDKWLADCQKLVDDYWTASGYADKAHMEPFRVTLKKDPNGKRYIRIVKEEQSGRSKSVYCFIDTTNGDVLKGSWKAPVKNAKRGNIFDGKPVNEYMTNYGCAYLYSE